MPKHLSFNFAVAKVLAILLVVTAHYFSPSPLWIVATLALFIFGFSSAYFTQLKYQNQFDRRAFWHAKLIRLGWPLLIMNTFLLGVFWVVGKQPLFDWQTPLHWLGLTGWFNWLGLIWPQLVNHSPWGAGLWFFTLLLMFYLAYPLLRCAVRAAASAHTLLLGSALLLALAHHWLPVGHMLWLTALAFICGLWFARMQYQPSIPVSIGLVGAGLGLFVGLKLLNLPGDFSFYWLLLVGLGVVGLLMQVRLPQWLAPIRQLDDAVIQIYFIHMALFLPIAPRLLGWLLSLVLIVGCAWVLARLTRQLAGR